MLRFKTVNACASSHVPPHTQVTLVWTVALLPGQVAFDLTAALGGACNLLATVTLAVWWIDVAQATKSYSAGHELRLAHCILILSGSLIALVFLLLLVLTPSHPYIAFLSYGAMYAGCSIAVLAVFVAGR